MIQHTGCTADAFDSRDRAFTNDVAANLGSVGPWPGGDYDYRPWDQPRTQYSPSCVGHAIAGACALTASIAERPIPFPSSTFVWAGARMLGSGDRRRPLEMVGCSIRNGLEWGRLYGLIAESRWPEATENLIAFPPIDAFTAGDAHRVSAYYRIPDGPGASDGMRLALAAGHCPVFAMRVGDAYGNVGKTVYEGPGDSSTPDGHAQAVVGFVPRIDAFIVRNTWGPTWGDNGYAMLSSRFVNAATFDKWVISVAPDGAE